MKRLHTALLLLLPLLAFGQGVSSRTEARIDQVDAAYGLTGDGVITVMMDRGIDWRHPDFIDENGQTRIAYLYDLYDDTGASAPNNPYGVGTIYDRAAINAALSSGGDLPTDIFGHGTATTGIMAGNGSAIADADRFKGVAPEATIISIIVTKDGLPPFGSNPGRAGQFNPGLLPSAFAFATDKIEELGLPSVTLLNIGSIGDPTDGSVSFCTLVDNYVAAGNPFVCGVGDDGGQDNSSVKTLTVGEDTDFVLEKGQEGFLRFTAWYAEDARVQLSIIRPDGTFEGPFAPPAGPVSARDLNLSGISIFHRGRDVEFSGSSAELRQLLIDFSGVTGEYTVRLSTTSVGSDNSIIGMLNPSTFGSTNRFTNTTMPGGNLASYSACFGTITPGDYVATNNFTDVNNVPRSITGQGSPGEIWLGSSVGPTMDGRIGVDFVAPGEIAIGAYSDDSFYGSFTFNQVAGGEGKYGIQTAVSAAAPIVTGLIALMLEVKPDLTVAQIRSILQETSRVDNFTGTTPNTTWGHGKIDAKAALDQVFDLVTVPELTLTDLGIQISPNPFQEDILISTGNFALNDYTIRIHNQLGENVLNQLISTNNSLSLSHLPSGVYFLTIETSKGTAAEKIVKR